MYYTTLDCTYFSDNVNPNQQQWINILDIFCQNIPSIFYQHKSKDSPPSNKKHPNHSATDVIIQLSWIDLETRKCLLVGYLIAINLNDHPVIFFMEVKHSNEEA